jgi:hypothetical protein
MLTCDWCRVEYDSSPLYHVCPDGSTFDDRMRYSREGKYPSALARQVVDPLRIRYPEDKPGKDYDYLPLAPDDMRWLIGLKIDWTKKGPR